MAISPATSSHDTPPPYTEVEPSNTSNMQGVQLDDLDTSGRRMVVFSGMRRRDPTPPPLPPAPRPRVHREPFKTSDATRSCLKGTSRGVAVAGVIAGTVVTVKLKEAATTVTTDPSVYTAQAHQFYANCYAGSNDTNPSFGPDNCALTNSTAAPDGTDCNWMKLWYRENSIPQPCLDQMVPGLHAQALSHAKNAQKRYYALFTLTIPAYFLAPVVPWAGAKLVEGVANCLR